MQRDYKKWATNNTTWNSSEPIFHLDSYLHCTQGRFSCKWEVLKNGFPRSPSCCLVFSLVTCCRREGLWMHARLDIFAHKFGSQHKNSQSKLHTKLASFNAMSMKVASPMLFSFFARKVNNLVAYSLHTLVTKCAYLNAQLWSL